VVNETQARVLGWKNAQDAIGGQLKFSGSPTVFTITGVTKDFHFGSMQHAIQPHTFTHVKTGTIFRFFSFKLKPGNISNSIALLQKRWSTLLSGAPFEYKFMDETLRQLYRLEIQLKQASYTATILSLVIVLLGVIGLVSLSVQKRTREIGIRKVLGSTVSGIIGLFIKEFLWIIMTGGLIACPVAWLIMHKWLSNYAYRISLTAAPFIISIAGLAVITALLITLQTIKAGTDNPVKSLRTE
jgi:ABC-type antimicrobial peptide transport system permease subunit